MYGIACCLLPTAYCRLELPDDNRQLVRNALIGGDAHALQAAHRSALRRSAGLLEHSRQLGQFALQTDRRSKADERLIAAFFGWLVLLGLKPDRLGEIDREIVTAVGLVVDQMRKACRLLAIPDRHEQWVRLAIGGGAGIQQRRGLRAGLPVTPGP